MSLPRSICAVIHYFAVIGDTATKAGSTRCVVRTRGASCVNVSKRFVESDTHIYFDGSIYHPIGEPDVTNERMTHLLKLDTFFHTHNAQIMTHDASRIQTTHRVDLA